MPGDKRKPEDYHIQSIPHRLPGILFDIAPDKPYKSAKLHEGNDAKSSDQITHGGDADDGGDENLAAGPELPSDYETRDSDDEEGGRFFGGGITAKTAGVLDFIDEKDQTDPLVRSKSLSSMPSCANPPPSEARKH